MTINVCPFCHSETHTHSSDNRPYTTNICQPCLRAL